MVISKQRPSFVGVTYPVNGGKHAATQKEIGASDPISGVKATLYAPTNPNKSDTHGKLYLPIRQGTSPTGGNLSWPRGRTHPYVALMQGKEPKHLVRKRMNPWAIAKITWTL